MAGKLLPGKLPNPPVTYIQTQFNQIILKIQQALGKEVQFKKDGEDREATEYFMS